MFLTVSLFRSIYIGYWVRFYPVEDVVMCTLLNSQLQVASMNYRIKKFRGTRYLIRLKLILNGQCRLKVENIEEEFFSSPKITMYNAIIFILLFNNSVVRISRMCRCIIYIIRVVCIMETRTTLIDNERGRGEMESSIHVETFRSIRNNRYCLNKFQVLRYVGTLSTRLLLCTSVK